MRCTDLLDLEHDERAHKNGDDVEEREQEAVHRDPQRSVERLRGPNECQHKAEPTVDRCEERNGRAGAVCGSGGDAKNV